MIGHISIIVNSSCFVTCAAHSPSATRNKQHLYIGAWPLHIHKTLNQRCKPILPHVLLKKAFTKPIVPHKPSVKILDISFLIIWHSLVLDRSWQVNVEAIEHLVCDVLWDLLKEGLRFDLILFGRVFIKQYESDIVKFIHDDNVVLVDPIYSADFLALTYHDQVVRLAHVQYTQQSEDSLLSAQYCLITSQRWKVTCHYYDWTYCSLLLTKMHGWSIKPAVSLLAPPGK